MSKLISDYFMDASHSLPYVSHLAQELHGLQRLFTKRIYSNQSVIRFAEHTEHQFIPDDVPANSHFSYELQAGEFSRGVYEIPFFATKTHLSAHTFLEPIPPESLMDRPLGERQRRAWHIANTWAAQGRMLGRELERQAASALWYGKIAFKHNTSPDFNRDPNAMLHVAKSWSDPSADILGDLTALAEQIILHGGSPDTVIMGPRAFDGMMKNEVIATLLDNRRIEIGTIAPRIQPTGMVRSAVLYIAGHPITFYQYNQKHDVPIEGGKKERRSYLDPQAVMMLDSSQELFGFFGSSILLDEYRLTNHITVQGMQFDAFVYPQPPSALAVGMQARPLLFPAMPNLTAVLKADGTKIEAGA
ncbi:major capsid protein (plasmid) [Entomospira nematocerorum]|uniref:Major capsid protein n=1 Tax=Entomospira nematocerorum TaxID=2719987 RepID=A0A968GE01_9SPIO|nr:major capsid protein [Entomospira nematocera]NIZ47768.1 hypothetical protein [Entomospira nematocera]WDI34722.1 major capsid protein [Entomospira nematocera]